MLMNYHEMTMGQPRNSESNRRQYLIVCTVMAAAFAWSVLQAGGLAPVDIEQGTFPGGKFVYKYTQRDYAAAQSLADNIAKDAGLRLRNETIDRIFAVYLDDPNLMGGRRQRFACGLLDSPQNEATMAEKQAALLQSNVGRVPPTKRELEDDGAFKLWPKLAYHEMDLPASKALVVQFPFTNGFVSAIILGFKVLPAMRQAALEAGADVAVVLSTCSDKEGMCTHYAPLTSASTFLFGQPDTDTYLASLEPEPTIDFLAAVQKAQRRASRWFGGWFGFVDTEEKEDSTKKEAVLQQITTTEAVQKDDGAKQEL